MINQGELENESLIVGGTFLGLFCLYAETPVEGERESEGGRDRGEMEKELLMGIKPAAV